MTNVFDLTSEVSIKDKLISQFSKWWSDDEIRTQIIPHIVDEKIKASVSGALKNYINSDDPKRKSFGEILYDLVGQNFLVNQEKSIRRKFLHAILIKKFEEDPSFGKRFKEYLIHEKKASTQGLCK